MRPVQNTDLSRSLERQFQLKGLIGLSVDEVVVPVALAGDFDGRSPWEPRGLVADSQSGAAAGVGTICGIYITPGAGSILVVESIWALASAVTSPLELRVFRPADVAAVTTVSTSPSVLLNGRMRSTGFAPQGMATSSPWNHTTHVLGALFHRINAHANDQNAEYRPPRGIVLDGTDPAGPISLAILTRVDNTNSPYISWYGTEYALSG